MKQIGLLLFFLVLSACTSSEELSRLEARAERVEIIRDDFGVPHIYAETDADAVFGMLYA
ncbi:MAG: penicillin acylase family protein, partial [Flavobacteriaceae bacterium]